MSRFSGKCDFCDEIEIYGLDHILDSAIYLGDSEEPLTLTCLADCIPYYPHIVSVASYNKTHGRSCIRLSKKSWVDIEEERYGHLKMHDIYRDRLARELAESGGSNGKEG